jgi:hypothetical protein
LDYRLAHCVCGHRRSFSRACPAIAGLLIAVLYLLPAPRFSGPAHKCKKAEAKKTACYIRTMKHTSRIRVPTSEIAVGGVAALVIAATFFYFGAMLQYSHLIEPPVTDIIPIKVTKNAATVLFHTPVPTSGLVYYSKTMNENGWLYIGGLYTRPQHFIDLVGLTPNTKYYYYIVATDPVSGLVNRTDIREFTTLKN